MNYGKVRVALIHSDIIVFARVRSCIVSCQNKRIALEKGIRSIQVHMIRSGSTG